MQIATDLDRTIGDIIRYNNGSPEKFRETANLINNQLEIVQNEFSSESMKAERIEGACMEIRSIIEDFDAGYVPDINSDPGLKPFSHTRDLLPIMESYC